MSNSIEGDEQLKISTQSIFPANKLYVKYKSKPTQRCSTISVYSQQNAININIKILKLINL